MRELQAPEGAQKPWEEGAERLRGQGQDRNSI